MRSFAEPHVAAQHGVRADEAEIRHLGVVRDDPEKLEAAFRDAAANADAIITTGGVSVGEADFVKPMMAKLGEALFWRIAMRPGRPMAFGRIGSGEGQEGRDSALLFGLPGNPVAVMVTFYHFVRAALHRLMGANVQQQFLNAGLVDEFHINIVPVLLGRGTRLFEKLDVAHIALEQIHAIPSPGVAHIAYRVIKPAR